IDNRAVDRYKIPLVVIGGALSSKGRIETYGSQIDIAATLLAQLNIEHLAFKYSKNMMDASSPHFGYFTFQNGFGMVTPENEYVFDCETGKEYVNTGRKNENKTKAEAFIQTLYNDIATK
ncbi:MAG: LTA synthase family protein, partial [Paludibacter sp.]|nr:LTA synthase family protein [Paludibacter sp.]